MMKKMVIKPVTAAQHNAQQGVTVGTYWYDPNRGLVEEQKKVLRQRKVKR